MSASRRQIGFVSAIVGTAALLAGCRGTVTDPIGDGGDFGSPDIVEAGADVRTATTEFFIRGDLGGSFLWSVSTDSDTTPELEVRHGGFLGRDRFEVTRLGDPTIPEDDVLICAGYGGSRVEGQDQYDDVVSLTIDTRCLGDPPTADGLPDGLRLSAFTDNIRYSDRTDWTAFILRS